MPILSLALKDGRLLLRDRRALVILILMPLVFILVLGLSLGEGFGQKADNRLRVLVVDLDRGHAGSEAASSPFGPKPWSRVVIDDLVDTAGVRVEEAADPALAERQVSDSRRPAVLIFGPAFSERVDRCSFLRNGINPFYRDGVRLRIRDAGRPNDRFPPRPDDLDFELVTDPTQKTAASIIEQVAQVSLLRVVLPWMIGRAFEEIGRQLGPLVHTALQGMFPKFDPSGKTWAALTRSEPKPPTGAGPQAFTDEAGAGPLHWGAANYQRLVPSYTVLFAFFLVLTTGWIFVAERRQGTLRRLRAAPLGRTEILCGKSLPCLVLSLAQGLLLLLAGRVVFGMSWGPRPLWLLPVVFTTSLAALGLAILIAATARTETQVAVYGTLLVLVLAGVSGCLMGDRELMPEPMQQISLLTPHAWALTAYKQLLTTSSPNLAVVARSCGVLTGFGAGLTALAWTLFRFD